MFKEYCEKNPTDKEQIEKLNKLTKLQMKDKIQAEMKINPKLIALKQKGDNSIKNYELK